MTPVVFPHVAPVESACSVWRLFISHAWHYMSLNLASKWRKRVCIVVMFPPDVCVNPHMGTTSLCIQGSSYVNFLAIPTRSHTGIPICMWRSLYGKCCIWRYKTLPIAALLQPCAFADNPASPPLPPMKCHRCHLHSAMAAAAWQRHGGGGSSAAAALRRQHGGSTVGVAAWPRRWQLGGDSLQWQLGRGSTAVVQWRRQLGCGSGSLAALAAWQLTCQQQ
jgi:hypothetical protein